MTDTVRRVQFRQPRRVASATTFQRLQGIVTEIEALGAHPAADEVLRIAERLANIGTDLKRGDA
ncbi:MAG TPA: hypothetical protein VD860_16850 [Azospirillum sp.]|nr:hypothetical protein [Azospirillum sp.]